jgi:hypothetical protein
VPQQSQDKQIDSAVTEFEQKANSLRITLPTDVELAPFGRRPVQSDFPFVLAETGHPQWNLAAASG